jgi:hypothetical protein
MEGVGVPVGVGEDDSEGVVEPVRVEVADAEEVEVVNVVRVLSSVGFFDSVAVAVPLLVRVPTPVTVAVAVAEVFPVADAAADFVPVTDGGPVLDPDAEPVADALAVPLRVVAALTLACEEKEAEAVAVTDGAPVGTVVEDRELEREAVPVPLPVAAALVVLTPD